MERRRERRGGRRGEVEGEEERRREGKAEREVEGEEERRREGKAGKMAKRKERRGGRRGGKQGRKEEGERGEEKAKEEEEEKKGKGTQPLHPFLPQHISYGVSWVPERGDAGRREVTHDTTGTASVISHRCLLPTPTSQAFFVPLVSDARSSHRAWD